MTREEVGKVLPLLVLEPLLDYYILLYIGVLLGALWR